MSRAVITAAVVGLVLITAGALRGAASAGRTGLRLGLLGSGGLGRRPAPAMLRAAAQSRWPRLLASVLMPPRAFSGAAAAAQLPWSADQAWRWWLGSAAFTGIGGTLTFGLPVVALMALVVGLPIFGLWLARHRHTHQIESQLPVVLEAVARSLRSGHSLQFALADAAAGAPLPVAADLRAVTALVDRGIPLVTALDMWASQRPLPSIRLAVAALALGAEAGGPHARALDGVAATLRERLELRREVRAQSTQARASAAVIVAAPLVFTGFSVAADPRTADFLFRSVAGWICLVVGLVLDGIAGWWMARIVDRSVVTA